MSSLYRTKTQSKDSLPVDEEKDTPPHDDQPSSDAVDTKNDSPPAPPSNDGPPNGGLTAWLQVLGSFMLFFNTWGILK